MQSSELQTRFLNRITAKSLGEDAADVGGDLTALAPIIHSQNTHAAAYTPKLSSPTNLVFCLVFPFKKKHKE